MPSNELGSGGELGIPKEVDEIGFNKTNTGQTSDNNLTPWNEITEMVERDIKANNPDLWKKVYGEFKTSLSEAEEQAEKDKFFKEELVADLERAIQRLQSEDNGDL